MRKENKNKLCWRKMDKVYSTSSKSCRIEDDLWELIGFYLTPRDLCTALSICKDWKIKVEYLEAAWKFHCSNLWIDKQNCPLERWVILPVDGISMPSVGNISEILAKLPDVDSKISCSSSEFKDLRKYIVELMEKNRGLNRKVRNLQENLDVMVPGNDFALKFDSYKTATRELEETKSKLSRFLLLRRRIKCKNMWMNGKRERLRTAAPSSRALVASWIRVELDFERCRDSLDPEEKIAFETHISINLNTVPSGYCLKDFEDDADEKGLLLSWKGSYIASILDSRRTRITYEELREQGDWLWRVNAGTQIQIVRFIRGGRFLISNDVFQLVPRFVELAGDILVLPDANRQSFVRRVREDWGWHLVGYQGFSDFASFDKRKGCHAHRGIFSLMIQRMIPTFVQDGDGDCFEEISDGQYAEQKESTGCVDTEEGGPPLCMGPVITLLSHLAAEEFNGLYMF